MMELTKHSTPTNEFNDDQVKITDFHAYKQSHGWL